jgi:hypothetical protein
MDVSGLEEVVRNLWLSCTKRFNMLLLNIILSQNWFKTTINIPPSLHTVTDEFRVAQLLWCGTKTSGSLIDQAGKVMMLLLIHKPQSRSVPSFGNVKIDLPFLAKEYN